MAEYPVTDVDCDSIDTEHTLERMPGSMNVRSEIRSVKVFCVKLWLVSFAAGIGILLFVSDCVPGQQSDKSLQTSGDSSGVSVSFATVSRTADLKPSDLRPAAKPDPSGVNSGGLISFERINELTGFVPASDAEVRELVAIMQAAVKAKDATALKACFALELMMARSIVGAEMPALQRSQFVQGGLSNNAFVLLSNRAMKSDSDFQLLRINRCGNELRPLFRFVMANEGLVYDEFFVQTVEGQGPKIVDVLPLQSREYESLCRRPFALGSFLSVRCAERIPTAGIETSIIDSAEGLADFTRHVAIGDGAGALAAIDKIRPPLDTHPAILVMKCAVSKSIGVSTYRQAVLQFAERYPETVSADLALLDLYRMEKDPAEMLAVADRLLKSMQDPWLNAYRIEGLVTQNRIKEAREAIAAAKAAAPNISDPYVDELRMLMKLKNHQETALAIKTLESKFGENVVKLTEFPEFDEFSDSDVGHQFLAVRAGFDF